MGLRSATSSTGRPFRTASTARIFRSLQVPEAVRHTMRRLIESFGLGCPGRRQPITLCTHPQLLRSEQQPRNLFWSEPDGAWGAD